IRAPLPCRSARARAPAAAVGTHGLFHAPLRHLVRGDRAPGRSHRGAARRARVRGAFFVAGTDTGVGKTLFSTALLRRFATHGLRAAGMKPIAAGCERGRNEDVEALLAASTPGLDRSLVCPYLFGPPIAPHIAAHEAGVKIDLAVIEKAFA